jgi:oligopeptide/dipeptide ABC transporter ATP-binding protein
MSGVGVAPSFNALIRVSGLTVSYASAGPAAPALAGVNLDIGRREVIGVLGESGSGKSTLALSILGMLPAGTQIQGSIFLHADLQSQRDLMQLAESEWQAIRGAKISMIFQEPGLCLSPVMQVGKQIGEVLRAHRHGKTSSNRERVEALLHRVGLSDTDRIYHAYPHQLSGGQLQRVAIAQALACEPNLLIADEVTRSLDALLQAEVIDLLREINQKDGTAILFITHNPMLLAGLADRVVVMYAGRIVEDGPATQVVRRPLHPYTQALLQLAASPAKNPVAPGRLPAIPGSLSDADRLARGCVFEPRCSARTAMCRERSPELIAVKEHRQVSCFNHGN